MEMLASTGISDLNYNIPDSSAAALDPFPSLVRAYVNPAAPGQLFGDAVFRPLNSIWGGMSVRNLSPQTSFAFYVRMTVECRVTPISPLAPQQQMSPAYDPVALASYYRISRELKDAYPADYNDLGKLWDVIKQAAKVALPVLSMVPGPVGMVGTALNAGVTAIDSFVKAGSSKKSKPPGGRSSQPPLAQAQRMRDRQAAANVRQAAQQRAKPRQRTRTRWRSSGVPV